MSSSSKSNREEDEELSCPSFSSYSENKAAETALKVTSENPPHDAISNILEEEDDDDFEFSCEVKVSSNGQIFPVFNRHILQHDEFTTGEESESQIAVPFITLLKRETIGNNIDSCSSSEADELEKIPSGTYCAWRPNGKCKKTRSAGSASRRWASLRDLMKRSNSEGMKDNFVFLTPKKNNNGASSAHEEFYVRNRAVKEGDKKKSYLPYRKELVGFFLNGNRFLPHV